MKLDLRARCNCPCFRGDTPVCGEPAVWSLTLFVAGRRTTIYACEAHRHGPADAWMRVK